MYGNVGNSCVIHTVTGTVISYVSLRPISASEMLSFVTIVKFSLWMYDYDIVIFFLVELWVIFLKSETNQFLQSVMNYAIVIIIIVNEISVIFISHYFTYR